MARNQTFGGCFAAVLVWLTIGATRAEAQVARLVGWAEPASLASLQGPGEPMFRLPAIIRWQAGASRDERAYQIEVRLPDGSTRLTPLTPHERPGTRTLSALIPAAAVRNLGPEMVRVAVTLVDATGAIRASNSLEATIADFPAPAPEGTDDRGPFGFGSPLDLAEPARRPLTLPDPDGLAFLPLPGGTPSSTAFLASQEVSNRQVALHLPTYDPKAGRSDEFTLDDPTQPAVGLTPSAAEGYLAALSKSVAGGVDFRLPTDAEWDLAARAGSAGRFWWGDDPTHPEGANLLGPEPGRAADGTARVEGEASVAANRWGFLNTYGNVGEWATSGSSGFRRMGGHFRTEADGLLEPIDAVDPEQTGPDPYVGVRPAFTLQADEVARGIQSLLNSDPALAATTVTFDAARATATLQGPVRDGATRRRADDLVRPLWFVAAVENRLESPSVAPGRLAKLTGVAGTVERRRVLDRFEAIVPVHALWADELPVVGSEWWVNVQDATGAWSTYRLPEEHVGEPIIPIVLPTPGPNGPAAGVVGLSLGAPELGLLGPYVASDPLALPVDTR